MSAWIVFPRHVDYLVEAIGHYGGLARLRYKDLPVEEIPPQVMGEELMAANVESVAFRYDYPFEELPGSSDKSRVQPYVYQPSGLPLMEGAVIAAVRCYSYQSCEACEWDGTAWVETWDDHPIKHLMDALVTACEARLDPELLLPTFRYGDQTPIYRDTPYYERLPWGIDPDTELEPQPAFAPGWYERLANIA